MFVVAGCPLHLVVMFPSSRYRSDWYTRRKMRSKYVQCGVGIRNWVAAKVSLDQPGSPSKEEEHLPRGEPVTLFRSLRDIPRVVHQLLLAPRCVCPCNKIVIVVDA